MADWGHASPHDDDLVGRTPAWTRRRRRRHALDTAPAPTTATLAQRTTAGALSERGVATARLIARALDAHD
eukprot:3492499-Alexandrium_andersonii.AAC.1